MLCQNCFESIDNCTCPTRGYFHRCTYCGQTSDPTGLIAMEWFCRRCATDFNAFWPKDFDEFSNYWGE